MVVSYESDMISDDLESGRSTSNISSYDSNGSYNEEFSSDGSHGPPNINSCTSDRPLTRSEIDEDFRWISGYDYGRLPPISHETLTPFYKFHLECHGIFSESPSVRRPVLRTHQAMADAFREVAAYYGSPGMPYMGPIPPYDRPYMTEFWKAFSEHHIRIAAKEEEALRAGDGQEDRVDAQPQNVRPQGWSPRMKRLIIFCVLVVCGGTYKRVLAEQKAAKEAKRAAEDEAEANRVAEEAAKKRVLAEQKAAEEVAEKQRLDRGRLLREAAEQAKRTQLADDNGVAWAIKESIEEAKKLQQNPVPEPKEEAEEKTQACPVCYTDITNGNNSIKTCAKHMLCKNCLSLHINAKADKDVIDSLKDIKCPMCNVVPIEEHLIRELIPTDKLEELERELINKRELNELVSQFNQNDPHQADPSIVLNNHENEADRIDPDQAQIDQAMQASLNAQQKDQQNAQERQELEDNLFRIALLESLPQ